MTTTLEAGREMDLLVAQRLMGWPYEGVFVGDGPLVRMSNGEQVATCPRFSTEIAAAWLVVARLNELGWLVVVKQMPEGVPYMIDPEGGKVHARVVVSLQWVQWMKDASADAFKIGPTTVGDTVPDAVCQAALSLPSPTPHVPDGQPR